MSANVIEIRNVYKQFQDSPVLENINLDIRNGEFLTLLGPSGCGKTTLLRLLSGFEEPDSGEIIIDGKNVAGLPPEQRHLNTVFQSYALFPHMTVYENVAFGLRCKHVPQAEIHERVQEALRMVKLEKYIYRKPSQLSGGQQQRVAIARAVVNRPLVLLLDESLSSLDTRLRLEMQVELKALQRKLGITFVFVTHDQEEALSMSDRVALLLDGHLEQVGTPREVYETPLNLSVAKFIGKANIFESTVTRLDNNDTKAHVVIEGNEYVLNNHRQFKQNEPVYVLVRPEDLDIWSRSEVSDTSKMLKATIKEVIYKGSTVDLVVQLENGKILAATEFFNEDDETLDFKRGEPVFVEWVLGWEVMLRDEKAR